MTGRPGPGVPLFVSLLAVLLGAPSAEAQWTRVAAIPPADVYALLALGDTLLAGADTAVFVSTDAGATWQASARVGPGVQSVDALWLTRGRLFAGTYGHGAFVSADLGGSWSPLNAGLAGGPPGSVYLNHFAERGDSLFAATDGAGVYALDLAAATAWLPFGGVPQANQAGGLPGIAHAGGRLVAAGGANGLAFWNDRGAADWTVTPLDNVGLSPGLQPAEVTRGPGHWLVATNVGCYRSPSGQGGWSWVGPAAGQVLDARFAWRGAQLFLAVNDLPSGALYSSGDEGATWHALEPQGAYVYELAMVDATLYAARSDGLWRRSVGEVSVPGEPPTGDQASLRVVGTQPVRGSGPVRLAWNQASPNRVRLDVHDVRGRLVARLLEREAGTGAHEAAWTPAGHPAGVYLVRLTTRGRSEAVRIVLLP